MRTPQNLAALSKLWWGNGRPQNVPISRWRLSETALGLSCIGAFLPGTGVAKSTTVGPSAVINASQLVWVGIANTAPTIGSTPEGLGWKTAAGARQESGSNFFSAGNASTSLAFSMVGRFVMSGAPAGDIQHLNWNTGASGDGKDGPSIGFTSGGFAKVWWRSDGSGLSGPATGSTNWNGAGPFTVGVSTNSSKNAILYENGANIATGTGGTGTDVANTTPAFAIGFYNGTDSFNGTTLWAFFFNRQLTDEEHWFVANNPWLLLEPVHSNIVGRAPLATGMPPGVQLFPYIAA